MKLETVRRLQIAPAKRYVLEMYLSAKRLVIEAGFESELEWQSSRSIEKVTESSFLAEAGWVVISAGMREVVVCKFFPNLRAAFEDFASAQRIMLDRQGCYERAMSVFRNERKIRAIVDIAAHVYNNGFLSVKSEIESQGVSYLYKLPFMGPATARHLAKNIGLPVGKPDRHLVRIAAFLGYGSVDDFCFEIASSCGDEVSVVDLVWWRFATLNRNYLELLTCGCEFRSTGDVHPMLSSC